jgi:hypothetical protein
MSMFMPCNKETYDEYVAVLTGIMIIVTTRQDSYQMESCGNC